MLNVTVTVCPFNDDELRAFRAALRELVMLAFEGEQVTAQPTAGALAGADAVQPADLYQSSTKGG